MTVLLEHALALAHAGYSVVPVTPGAKKPPLVSWQEYQSVRAAPELVEEWWTEWPRANIAIVTGTVSNVNVVDLDPRSGAVLTDWNYVTPFVATPSGGRHLYFRSDITSGSPVGVLPGVDLRCNGAYVIAPPSEVIGGEVVPLAWSISPHDWERLLRHDMLPWSDVVGRFTEARSSEAHEPWIATALADGAAIGEQRHTLTRLAGYFARRLPKDVALGLLWGATQSWPQDPADPWRLEQVEQLVNWAFEQATKDGPTIHLTGGGTVQRPVEDKVAQVRARVRSPRARRDDPGAQVTWVAENFLAAGAVTELISPPKLGKTTLMLSVVRSILRGDPAFGAWPTHRSRVFLLSEQSPPSFTGSVERAGLGDADDLFVLLESDLFQLEWPVVVDVAVEAARAHDCKVLVVDTLAWLSGVEDENRAEAAKQAVGALMPAIQAGLSVLLVRHSRKSDSSIHDAGRGSSAWSGATDIIARLTEEQDNMRRLRTIGRLGDPQDVLLTYAAGQYALAEQTPQAAHRDNARQEKLDDVSTWLTAEWRTVAEIAQAAKKNPETVAKKLVRFRQEHDPEGNFVQRDNTAVPRRWRLSPVVKLTGGKG